MRWSRVATLSGILAGVATFVLLAPGRTACSAFRIALAPREQSRDDIHMCIPHACVPT
jgi:hypothetical protein